jgi:hypothetical protein
MEDCFEFPGGEDLRHAPAVADFGLDQFDPVRHRGPMALAEIVNNNDLRTTLHQGSDEMAADITGPASDEETPSVHASPYSLK